jgi:hypothetical protein
VQFDALTDARVAQETADDDDQEQPVEPAPLGTTDDPAEPDAADLDVDPSLAAAREHLRAEGEHVPKVLPAGFAATTAEGEPRCYARKGDGSQCANPARVDGEHSTYSCGLAKHAEQVSHLP